MALLIRVRPHPDELVDELCGLLASPPADPFAGELAAVPTRGIERWLTQRIASEMAERAPGGGVCANVEFPSPRRLIRRVMLAVPELEASAEAWSRNVLTRTAVSVIDSNLHHSWMWLVRRYVDAPDVESPLGDSRRFQAAAKIARLFRRYARLRPAMIRAWRQGALTGPGGGRLPDSEQWQPRLWRLLRDRIGAPALPELLPAALDPVRDGSIPLDLPDRLFIYGLTSVNPADLEIYEALAVRRDVHLYLLHPSPALWRRTSERLAQAPPPAAPTAREQDPSQGLARHPLLRSWAQESREMQVLLAGRGADAVDAGAPAAGADMAASPTLLARFQRSIRADEPPALAGAPPNGPDRSIQIHVCHGARRQVEVLRDAILHVFAADPALQPRDVVVMTPDIAAFAPLLEAAFQSRGGRGEGEDSAGADGGQTLPDLRVRIADQAPAAVNPLVRFTSSAFDLAGSRLEAGAVRELLALPVVRQRFGLDDEAADAVAEVIEDTNVRWGVDAEHRAAWGAGGLPDNTWRRGLDRALAGVFYSDSPVRVVDGVAPLDGIEGSEARPVGLLAQILDRVTAVREILGQSRRYTEWGPAIAAAVRLLAAPAFDEQWQWSQLERLLERSFPPPGPTAPGQAPDPVISPAEAWSVIDEWAEPRPSPLHFRTGDITVCTLVPMRSVPYRVVCLLGMDDHRFPRAGRVDGDDLLSSHELVGDPDTGAEDRQLLLDAVMAAGDHLIITYSGHDELTNSEYPPAVPIADLRDALYDMAGEEGLGEIITRHPLQPFSEANFAPGRLGLPGPWGFDPRQYDGAAAVQRRSDRPAAGPDLPRPLDDPPLMIRLDDLIRFFDNPARHFIRARLGFSIPEARETPDDTLADSLDALEKWQVANRFLEGLRGGCRMEELVERERGMDSLPPGALAARDLEAVERQAGDIHRGALALGCRPGPHSQYTGTVVVDPQSGRSVEGSVTADERARRIDLVTPSRLKGKQRLRTYIRLVFLTALEPRFEWSGRLVGRRAVGDKLWTVDVNPLGGGPEERKRRAVRRLADLAGIYLEGLAAPVPLPCETAYIWQRRLGSGREEAMTAAGRVWESQYSPGRMRIPSEGEDPAFALLFPEAPEMARLAGGSRFEEYARRLWGPVLPLLSEKAPPDG